MGDRLKPGSKDALVVVDVQNDFCPGGRLAVQKGLQRTLAAASEKMARAGVARVQSGDFA